MKRIKLFFVFILISGASQAQIKFKKTFLGSCDVSGKFIEQCQDSGYVLVSSTCFGIYVVRTNEYGDTLWTKMLDDTVSSILVYPITSCVRQTSDHGFLITGRIANDVGCCIKLDSAGNREWTYHNGDDPTYFHNILEQDTGGYIISAYEDGPTSSNIAYYFGIDDFGNPTFINAYSTGGGGLLNFDQTLDHGIISYVSNQTAGIDSIIKFGGTNGGWQKLISYYPSGITPLPDSGFIITNYYGITKIDANGDSLWTNSPNIGYIIDLVYVDSIGNEGYGILSTDTISYSLYHSDDDIDFRLSRTDTSGNIIWTIKLQGSGFPSKLIYTKDGGFAIISSSTVVAENSATIIIKTDSAGNFK